ncbi:MAG: response regulator, partial [Pseudomonadota bacterium]
MNERTLRVLVADDEATARRRLVRLLAAFPHVTVVAECTNGREVIAHLEACQRPPDILLLDIRMPELSGLEACALLPEESPYVIFATAHSEHALEAFEVGAEDYLLKPIEAASLERALR